MCFISLADIFYLILVIQMCIFTRWGFASFQHFDDEADYLCQYSKAFYVFTFQVSTPLTNVAETTADFLIASVSIARWVGASFIKNIPVKGSGSQEGCPGRLVRGA